MGEHQRLTDEDYGLELPFWRRRKTFVAVSGLIVILILVTIIVVSVVVSAREKKSSNEKILWESLSTDNILAHLNQFNTIALAALNKSRSISDGYSTSAEYVSAQISAHTDYEVTKQYFTVPVYVQLSPPTLSQFSPLALDYVLGVDFSGTRYGGNGTYHIVNSSVVVDNYGCDAVSDYVNITAGCIAVVFDGNCSQYQKALNAEAAGASAILIVRQAGFALANWRVRSLTWTPNDPLVQIPVLGITYSLGNTLRAQQLKEDPPTVFEITTNTQVTIEETYNVLCLTKKGNEESIMVVGAHLDGVPEGPGLNDNASGSSSVLEIALQLHKSKLNYENKILFAFWGAEEIGLLGSRYFVSELSTPSNKFTRNNTVLNLNFDMLGSPNFVRYVYNASTIADPATAARSVKIEQLFADYFNSRQLAYTGAAMTGGSDYFSFTEAGIPAGALATGAGALKSEAEREIYGGLANAALDTCYHQKCDSIANIDAGVLNDMSKAAAYTTQKLALQRDLVKHLQG